MLFMTRYHRLNTAFGWTIFLISGLVYFLTMEPTVSFWDCGEFIAAAFRLQVGHQPGAPLFLMLGKAFSLLASTPERLAFWVNLLSVLASAATCMFLFWTITALAIKLVKRPEGGYTLSQEISIFGAAMVGTLAFTFSDTFWFSAVESEVYALSALCTALVFWAILKWEVRAAEPGADRWLVLIAYIIGLSIGIHLLNLLAIPAIALVIYLRRSSKTSVKGAMIALLAGCATLAFIQYGVIQYLVYFAARFDLFFVNILHLGFGSGAVFFALLLSGAIGGALVYAHRKRRPSLQLALVCFTFVVIGFSSYAMIAIRAIAKTPINISNPDNPFSLVDYLGRQQYGSTPLLYGNYFDAEITGAADGGTIYRKGAQKYEPAGKEFHYEYDRNTLFPRTYSQRDRHPAAYRQWLGLGENEPVSFAANLQFLSAYQFGHMYLRYFLWNFAGKQNDVQGQGDFLNGNWLTGIAPVDALHLGNQSALPKSITQNEGYNRFYALPFLLGLAGLLYHFRKNRKDAGILGVLFLSTGLAIVLVLNMDPNQVRERDYIYVGSFYTFAIWIGLGVLAVKQLLEKVSPAILASAFSVAVCFAAVPALMGKEGWNDHNRADRFTARDMAANYLNSCAPNAVLFCLADNDTYPLWYAQQVEGIRKDVRIVNMELLYSENNITQLKKQLFDSAPLPVTMAESKYSKGTRDYLPFKDLGIADSVELKDLLEVMLSDNPADQLEMMDGSRENFLPTKKFKISIDPAQVLGSGTVSRQRKDELTDKMEWTYPKDHVTKGDLAILDFLAHNQWKRPVYFTIGLGASNYFGLNRYLYNEGFAYRLLPLKRDVTDTRDSAEMVNTEAMTDHLLHKFRYSFRSAHYLDPESRQIGSMTWDGFNTLAATLYRNGDEHSSRQVMAKALNSLPFKSYSYLDSADKYRAAINFYQLKDVRNANRMIKEAIGFLGSELNYYASLDEARQRSLMPSLGRVVSLLDACRSLAAEQHQPAISREVEDIYDTAQKKLVFSIRG